MQIIDHKDKKFIEINGKQFYLWQSYRESSFKNEPIFLQVYGKTPLRYEDLPDKKWIILKTRIPGRTKKGEREYIYTAYDKDCFDMDTHPFERKAGDHLMFIGRDVVGSAYLCISTLARLFDLTMTESAMMELARKLANGPFDIRNLTMEESTGNLKNTAFYLKTFGNAHYALSATYLKKIFGLEAEKKKNGKNGRKKK